MNDLEQANGESAEPVWELTQVVDALVAANAELRANAPRRLGRRALPSREVLAQIVADLRAVLFPDHFGPPDLSENALPYYIGHQLDSVLLDLQEQVRRGLYFACDRGEADCHDCSRRAIEITRDFARRLPAVRALLATDIRAAYEGDPALSSADEAVFCYPGIVAVTHYRLAHNLHALGVPLIPRIVTELAHAATGIDIHPGARIGSSFFIDHGTGVVIGETAVVGERVRLYQGVTLGARSFPTDPDGHPIKGRPRHPIVQDDVTIYAGATILGRITIGRGSSIGGNVWLTRGVPPSSHITQAQIRDDLFDGGSGI